MQIREYLLNNKQARLDWNKHLGKTDEGDWFYIGDNICVTLIFYFDGRQYDSFGEVVESESIYKIFEIDNKYYKLKGWGSSYGGDEWENWTELEEVEKKEEVITVVKWVAKNSD
jgi:hypothetical protein